MSDFRTEFSNGETKKAERLDVEDEDARQGRMHNLLMQLDKSTTYKPQSASVPLDLNFNFGDRRTYAVGAPSELLSRVQAFLPELAASNADLNRRAQEDPESINMEKVSDKGQFIQMNLGLGVFEARNGLSQETVGTGFGKRRNSDIEMRFDQVSPMSYGSSDSSSSDSNLEMSEDDDSNSDTSSVDIISTAFTSLLPRPIRPLPRRASTRPEIVVLGDGDHSRGSCAKMSGSSSPSVSDSQT